MEHPYLAQYHDASDEPVSEEVMLEEEVDRSDLHLFIILVS